MSIDGWSYNKYGEYKYEWRNDPYVIAMGQDGGNIRVTLYDDSNPIGDEVIRSQSVESKNEAYQTVKSFAESVVLGE